VAPDSRVLRAPETDADPLAAGVEALTSTGVLVMAPGDLKTRLGMTADGWTRFSAHWDDLAPDSYAAELGLHRRRRYGLYSFVDGVVSPMQTNAFIQPQESNPLYIDRDRHFEPLTGGFAEDPLLRRLLTMLGRFADALDDVPGWIVKVHPFRVIAFAGSAGQPTPEGLHRDGVTLVTSLLVRRRNARGGESSVFDLAGRHLLTTTLADSGTLLLGDDRRSVHGVTPIQPADPAEAALRDVLVTTFAPF
jgi:hypothetical protein